MQKSPVNEGGKIDHPEPRERLVKVGRDLPPRSRREALLTEDLATAGCVLDESKPVPLTSAPDGFELSSKFGHDVPLARLRCKPNRPSEISLSRIVVRRALRAPPVRLLWLPFASVHGY